MKYLKALILGSIIALSGCTSVKNFSQDFTKKYMNNFEIRYNYNKERGKIPSIIKAEKILKNYSTLENYFYENEYGKYEEFTDELKDEFGKIAEKSADKTLNQYPWYKRIKNLFRLDLRYGYKKRKEPKEDKLKEDIDISHINDTWPFINDSFKVKGGVKLSKKFKDYFEEPFHKAVNPEVYCKLMKIYNISWYPVKRELKQEIKLRYGYIESEIYHQLKENLEVEKLGIGLHWSLNKNCILNFNFDGYLRGNDEHLKGETFSFDLSIRF